MKAIKDLKKLKFSIIILISFLLFLSFVSSLYGADHAMMIFESRLHSSADFYERIDEYKAIVKELDEQIKNQMDANDWLYLKIKRINESGREADQDIIWSLEKKRKFIKKLSQERQRYSKLIKSLYSKIKTRQQRGKIQGKQKLSGKIASDKKRPAPEIKNIPSAIFDKKQLYFEVKKANLSDWLEISGNEACLKLKTTLPILFPVGSAKIAPEYKSFFTRLAKFLKGYEVKIMVNGYADIDPIHTDKYHSNFELGAIRAANVAYELINNGLKPSIFNINSPGEYRLSAGKETKHKALERRAEVVIIFIS